MTRRSEGGYIALATAFLVVVLVGCAALAVDLGAWYVKAAQLQRTADAAALSGVPELPADPSGAYTTAKDVAARNGFKDGEKSVVITAKQLDKPTQLQVTATQTVPTIFAGIVGIPTVTITRQAVADYSGPVPMGSPCNEFGNDPESAGVRGSTCDGVKGQFWVNVAGPATTKVSGDAFQAGTCDSAVDGCSGSTNADYTADGYFYAVHVLKPMSRIAIEAFDPSFVDVGDTCSDNFGSGTGAATTAVNPYVGSPKNTSVYAGGASNAYCTGDHRINGTPAAPMKTQFTVRSPGPNPWNPLTYPEIGGRCTQTFDGYDGDLKAALNQGSATYRDAVARTFRRWVPLCDITAPVVGDYLVQVKTNGLGADGSAGHNRFALRVRAIGGSNEDVSIAGLAKMDIYANLPGAQTEFYLARVPSGAGGQILHVRLFDVGDTSQDGTIQVIAPPDSRVAFSNCTGSGVSQGSLPDCKVSVPRNPSPFNGKWQTISVVIPAGYSCDDRETTACWVRLKYDYSGGSPTDTTAWSASLAGDPVRLAR